MYENIAGMCHGVKISQRKLHINTPFRVDIPNPLNNDDFYIFLSDINKNEITILCAYLHNFQCNFYQHI